MKKSESNWWHSCGNTKGCIVSYILIIIKILNSSLERGCFPNELKLAEVTPVFKNEDELSKLNYHPVNVLSHASEISERIVFNQMDLFFESTFSPKLTAFRKNHSTQNTSLNMIEKWKHAIDKGKKVGTIFMDLSKAFDTLNHNLLLAKLTAYGFSFNAIKFVQSYLSERFQRVNINNNLNEWCKILLGVPIGVSILCPLLFSIFINDIFSTLQDAYIFNFADDNSLYSIEDNLLRNPSQFIFIFSVYFYLYLWAWARIKICLEVVISYQIIKSNYPLPAEFFSVFPRPRIHTNPTILMDAR